MDFTIRDLPARKNHVGAQVVDALAAGKKFAIETSPGGEELVNYTVPAGKVARIAVTVIIDESDA